MEFYPQIIEPLPGMADDYWSVFINQPAYSLMTDNREEPQSNRYYRPRLRIGSEEFKTLTRDTIRRHLRGEITCMYYAADPVTQLSKWACIDGDYPDALDHLMVLHRHFRDLGLCPLLEQSRRGAHLWIFLAEAVLSVHLRALILYSISTLNLPLFAGDVLAPGLEVFPRQDYLEAGRFGNGIRGPLGVHRKDFKRYWFVDAERTLSAQMALLVSSRTLTREKLLELTKGLRIEPAPLPVPKISVRVDSSRVAFSIFDHFSPPSSSTSDYKVVCPACTEKRLVITARGSRRGFYHCFSGCSTAAIRAALGQPLYVPKR